MNDSKEHKFVNMFEVVFYLLGNDCHLMYFVSHEVHEKIYVALSLSKVNNKSINKTKSHLLSAYYGNKYFDLNFETFIYIANEILSFF